MLNVHIFESILLLLFAKLVEQSLLHVDPLNVQNRDQALVIAPVTQIVVHVSPLVVHVDFLVNHITWSTHVRHQVESNVFESEITIERLMRGKYQEMSRGVLPPSSLCITN